MSDAQNSAAPGRRGTPGSRGTTRDVRRPWKIGKAKSKTKPHMVRWVVAGGVFTSTFARGRRLVAFFAVLYYAGLRPAEAVALREIDCQLPDKGWGRLILAKTLPITTKKWTDSGNRHDPRGLKQRDANAVRNAPIPPWLVEILKAHIKEFGVADDGRLFRNERGGIVGSTTFSRMGGGEKARLHTCSGRITTRWAAVRPSPCCAHHLVERRRESR
ncbi:hypothetical protein [Actinoallomurus acaciae]|uniref:Phage integrase family protein n=1 Tax=Actinoallomurus acaciae TaxID=502577 RepID=A0ABV5Y7J4_9ACTN